MTSKQNKLIMEALETLHNHPTADEVYMWVRARISNISLGTVYRNLNQLTREGKIQQLGHAGEQKRFDASTHKHYHLVCRECCNVYDLKLNEINDIKTVMDAIQGHEITDYDLEFYGTCMHCKHINQ